MQREKSDCLRACIASVFEIDWEDAPDTTDLDNQHNILNEWLKERGLVEWSLDALTNDLRRGITHHQDGTTSPANFMWPYPPVAYYVGGGESARGVDHAVVMHGGEIVHDPHPDQDMTIDRIRTISVFVRR
jgi:hypothetical protein